MCALLGHRDPGFQGPEQSVLLFLLAIAFRCMYLLFNFSKFFVFKTRRTFHIFSSNKLLITSNTVGATPLVRATGLAHALSKAFWDLKPIFLQKMFVFVYLISTYFEKNILKFTF